MVSISRREFLRVSSLAAAASLAAACVQPVAPAQPVGAVETPPAAAPAAPTPQPEVPRYKEAPCWPSARVAQGLLPPVDDRLPENPLVVTDGADGIGRYGGNIRRAFKGVSDNPMLSYFNHRKFLEFHPDYSLRADVAESWENNEDACVWTVHLRKGMKWSDGSPFGAADVTLLFHRRPGQQGPDPLRASRLSHR